MQYNSLAYVPESEDPSLTLETSELSARICDNTGLLAPAPPAGTTSFLWAGPCTPFTHHLGYHGIRALYRKDERRNIVAPFVSWLNLQLCQLEGIERDPVDERSCFGAGRGWPLRLEPRGRGARLTLEPLPSMRMQYSLELQPAEPDAFDMSFRFRFERAPETGPRCFRASWPCYINAFEDVGFCYPQGRNPEDWTWTEMGEKQPMVLGETVGYRHQQQTWAAENQAFPLGYGRIGRHVLILMFSDPRVVFFMVNAGGHMFFSSTQNPAWDFSWVLRDYPLNETVGFDGRLIYTRFEGPDQALARYREWRKV